MVTNLVKQWDAWCHFLCVISEESKAGGMERAQDWDTDPGLELRSPHFKLHVLYSSFPKDFSHATWVTFRTWSCGEATQVIDLWSRLKSMAWVPYKWQVFFFFTILVGFQEKIILHKKDFGRDKPFDKGLGMGLVCMDCFQRQEKGFSRKYRSKGWKKESKEPSEVTGLEWRSLSARALFPFPFW